MSGYIINPNRNRDISQSKGRDIQNNIYDKRLGAEGKLCCIRNNRRMCEGRTIEMIDKMQLALELFGAGDLENARKIAEGYSKEIDKKKTVESRPKGEWIEHTTRL